MKKILLLLIVLLFPFFVNALELPSEGVTYFIEYPDGRERVTESYNEAKSISEELILETTTNENGEIILNGWRDTGSIRVVQDVPDGYTTQEREIIYDLSDSDNNITFTDYRGIVNPNTGRSILYFIGLMIIILSVVLIVRLSTKINAQQVVSIIIISLLLICSYYVKADTKDCVIKVKDGLGRALSNVTVRVYATPLVEASPAIKFDAAGGVFADGSSVMYYRIDGEVRVTVASFINSLSDNDYDWLMYNRQKVTRNGYYPVDIELNETNNGRLYFSDMGDTSRILLNGNTFTTNWIEDRISNVITIDGNGGVMNAPGGRTLTRYRMYPRLYTDFSSFNGEFFKGNSYYVGSDNTPACTNYPYGSKVSNVEYPGNIYYLCWVDEPDGIYALDSQNDFLYYFLGSKDNCFKAKGVSLMSSESIPNSILINGQEKYVGDGHGSSHSGKIILNFYNIYNSNLIEFSAVTNTSDGLMKALDPAVLNNINRAASYYPISNFKVIYHGDMLLNLNLDGLNYSGDGASLRYSPINENDKRILTDYFSGLIDSCFDEGKEVGAK